MSSSRRRRLFVPVAEEGLSMAFCTRSSDVLFFILLFCGVFPSGKKRQASLKRMRPGPAWRSKRDLGRKGGTKKVFGEKMGHISLRNDE